MARKYAEIFVYESVCIQKLQIWNFVDTKFFPIYDSCHLWPKNVCFYCRLFVLQVKLHWIVLLWFNLITGVCLHQWCWIRSLWSTFDPWNHVYKRSAYCMTMNSIQLSSIWFECQSPRWYHRNWSSSIRFVFALWVKSNQFELIWIYVLV